MIDMPLNRSIKSNLKPFGLHLFSLTLGLNLHPHPLSKKIGQQRHWGHYYVFVRTVDCEKKKNIFN